MHRVSVILSTFPCSSSSDEQSPIIFDIINSVGYIILNRPEALNALDLNMMNDIQNQLLVKSNFFLKIIKHKKEMGMGTRW